MCNFFSLVSDGKGKIFYFDWTLREKCIKKELNFEPDSHTSIATHFGFDGKKEDSLNKYEYNPLTKVFTVDQINTKDDRKNVEEQCHSLDFKLIVPQLIIKPIIHPFKDVPEVNKVTQKDIALLKQWVSVWASVRYSVGVSVGVSVGDSVVASVWYSVGDSVRASVVASVWASVGDSVRASVGDSVRAYAGSFVTLEKWEYIKHKKGEYPYQPLVELWERGLVPSFDGNVWRLHTGKDAKIIYEWKK